MSDRIVFKDVWLKNDSKVETDAIAAWDAAGDRLGKLTSAERAKILSVVAYDGDRLCGTATGQVRYLGLVRENMAFLQAFVVPEYRSHSVVIGLASAFHAVMQRFAASNPQFHIGGIAARIVVDGVSEKPVGRSGMVLIGYTEDNVPVKIRWFDHYRVNETAARTRDPKVPTTSWQR
jgi:hypothetical protein